MCVHVCVCVYVWCVCVCVCMCACVWVGGCEKVCTVCVFAVCELIGAFSGVKHTADTATFAVQKNNTKVKQLSGY